MAELTFKSAGVSTREIDLSGPTAIRPQGIPAGVIGTAKKGPAFVPITVATYADFVAEFGGTDGKKFGPLAMNEWMKNARAGTYVRVLGVGDAKKRDSVGRVTNAGFVVGAQLPQNASNPSGGALDDNPMAFDDGTQGSGRTYFLGALMREPYNSDGEAGAVADFTVDPETIDLDALASLGIRGESLRFADTSGETLTLWFHEGTNDTSSAGSGDSKDLEDFEDSKNLLLSIGSRSSATLSVVSLPTAGRIIQFTDMEDNTLTVDFNSGGADTAAADAGGGSFTASLDITVHVDQDAIAAALHGVITAAEVLGFGMLSAESGPADSNLVLTMTDVGVPSDEVDGGVVIDGEITITGADGTDQAIDGGFKHENATDLATAIVDKVEGATIAAGLTFSSALGVVTVTNTTGGANGNVANLGKITNALLNDVQTIQITGVAAGAITVGDTTATTENITFVDSAVPGDLEVSSQAATAATHTIVLEFMSALADGDTLVLNDGAGQTRTITVEAGDAAGAMIEAVAGVGVTIDSTFAGYDASNVQTYLVDAIIAANGDGLGMTAAADGDDVLITHTTADATSNAATVIATFTDASIQDDDGATVNLTGGKTLTPPLAIADSLAAKINALTFPVDVHAESDGVDTVTVTQMQAGVPTTATLADGGGLADATIAAPSTAGDDGDDTAPLGSPATGLSDAITSFAGGGDAVESGPQHTSWEDAGIDTDSQSAPIIRAVLMTPRGVHATLRCLSGDAVDGTDTAAGNQTPEASPASATDVNGGPLGEVTTTSNQERFTLLLNGHVNTSANPSSLRCSFDPSAPDYFMNILNTDPSCLEHAGHLVYTHYDIPSAFAGVDAHGRATAGAAAQAAAFLVPGNNPHDADVLLADGTATSPNYEDFQDRFQTAKSPWVISQVFGSKPKNLFKIHALDDGAAGSGKFKITISNVMMGAGDEHGRFDLFVRDISDDDVDPRVYEKFIGLDLNPNSERYISRVIGDQYMYYDFDKRPGSQKLVVDGIHPQRSKYIRVEMAPEVDSGAVPSDALPLGYRGYKHLVTSHNNDTDSVHYLESGQANVDNLGNPAVGTGSVLNDAIEPPVPMRATIAQGTGDKKRVQAALCWGTMFQVMDSVGNPNNSVKFNSSILSYGKYFPSFRSDGVPQPAIGDNAGAKPPVDSAGATVGAELDSDKFNNNMFSLERIQVITKNPNVVQDANPQVKGNVDHKQWAVAEYRRAGVRKADADMQTLEGVAVADDADVGTRFLDPKVDLSSSTTRRYMKFSFFLQGGFDGTNILNSEKAQLTNRAAVWEMDDANQGGTAGSTVASFRKAIDVMAEKADVDIKLLAVPGMRDEAITDYAIDAVEDRFDAMYIMDIEEKAVNNDLMIDYSTQKPSVNLTVEELNSRNLDSSFAAVYFPDVVITDPALGTNVQCPPSVAVLGAFSLNDSMAHPWFAPAGFSRGALKSVVETQVKLSRTNLDTLYESDVNPLAAFPHTPGVVVWGQKTLQRAQSALDRVNVRRLLIEIRREVRTVGNGLLFEPNREETLGRFSAAVNPILQRIQQQQGLDKFKVVIDTTTTTQADIENNTVRGKIFLQPTRTVEFISLDFVVTNAGMEV